MVRDFPPIFQLLHVALGRSERLVEPMSDAQWTELLDTAKKQTLTGILMEGIKRLPADQQPETETMFAWLAAAERTKQNSRRLNKAAVMLSERLLKDGFHSVILKGQGVSLLYPDPLTRTPGDIDIWMEGGRDRIVRYIRHHFPDEPVVYHHMDFPVFKKVCVEAHFTPSWMYSPVTNRRLQQWFRQMWPQEQENRQALPEEAGSVSVSTPAFNRVFIAVHIYRHLLDEGIGLRQVLDYYYVLHGHTPSPAEREASVHILKRLGMSRFLGALMWVLHTLFGLEEEQMLFPADEKEGSFLLNEIMEAGNFGKHDSRFEHEKAGDSHLRRFLRKQRRNVHFLSHYPSEVLWHPLFRIAQFVWRRWKGYA